MNGSTHHQGKNEAKLLRNISQSFLFPKGSEDNFKATY